MLTVDRTSPTIIITIIGHFRQTELTILYAETFFERCGLHGSATKQKNDRQESKELHWCVAQHIR